MLDEQENFSHQQNNEIVVVILKFTKKRFSLSLDANMMIIILVFRCDCPSNHLQQKNIENSEPIHARIYYESAQ